ncbi:MAG: hypothetical protein ACPG6T_03920 [Paracoccaceae bacterium]
MHPFLTSMAFKIFAPIAGLALLAGAFVWHGNSRYNDGVDDTDAKWIAAGELLEEEAEAAALVADAEKDIRDQAFAEGQGDLQEEVDNAKTNDIAGGGVTNFFSELRRQAGNDSDQTTP